MSGISTNRTNIVLPGAVSSDIIQKTQEASAVMNLARQVQLPGTGVTSSFRFRTSSHVTMPVCMMHWSTGSPARWRRSSMPLYSTDLLRALDLMS